MIDSERFMIRGHHGLVGDVLSLTPLPQLPPGRAAVWRAILSAPGAGRGTHRGRAGGKGERKGGREGEREGGGGRGEGGGGIKPTAHA